MKIQHQVPSQVRSTLPQEKSPEPLPPPPPPEQSDEFIETGLRWGLVGGLGLSALLGYAQGFSAIALSAIPTGAGLGLLIGIGLQLIEDS